MVEMLVKGVEVLQKNYPLLQHMVPGISMRELLGHKAIYQPGVARKSMRPSRTISTLQLISAGKHATTLGHLLQCGMQYDIVLGMFVLTGKEHWSVVSHAEYCSGQFWRLC